jgi:PAS domain S-box-containing protein
MTEPRVLLIEDNALTRSLIAASLSDEPMALIEASSGLEGIERARVESPDIVLLDLGLPDLSGFAVAERLREGERRHVAILALAGLLEEADERRLALARFDEVITKPIDPARLREALRAQLQLRHPDAGVSFGSKRLLLVDDDPLQRKLATVRLSRLGFEVTCSAHGAHAMQLADESPPDAIVSDVLMPQIDGFELCARLRADERFAQTKIILLTNSYLEESDRALARRVGADAYVHREPALNALIDALRSVFSHAPSERPSVSVPELRSERAERAARQLDKQVVLNVSLSRRAAILSAEIAILDGLARALADNRDPDSAIEAALSACFDAGRIEWGVMFTREPSGAWAHRSVGLRDPALRGSLSAAARRFERGFDERETHQRTVAELFGVALSGQVLVAPMRYREQTIGAMVFGVDAAPTDDQRAFATVVATQIALVLALSGTFAQLQRATQAERERVHVLESILDTIHEPIMVVDRDVRPVHWNRAAAEMPSSHLAREAHEWPAAGLLHADMSTPLRDDERPVLRALRGEDVDNCEVFMHRESDHPAWLSIAARPVRDDRGTITGAVIMTRDVTVEKRARAANLRGSTDERGGARRWRRARDQQPPHVDDRRARDGARGPRRIAPVPRPRAGCARRGQARADDFGRPQDALARRQRRERAGERRARARGRRSNGGARVAQVREGALRICCHPRRARQRVAARAGVSQPDRQRGAGDRAERGARRADHDSHGQQRGRRGARRGVRHGLRDVQRGEGADLHAVLHDQAARQRDGAGAVDLAQDRHRRGRQGSSATASRAEGPRFVCFSRRSRA